MKHLLSLNQRLASSCWEFAEVGWAASATIAARLPMIVAAAEGAQAGAMQTARATFKVMTGQSHPAAMAHHMIDVAEAATRPAAQDPSQRQTPVGCRRVTEF